MKLKSQNSNFRKDAGFTIIEVLIASFVFSIIVLITSGIFVQILNNQQRAFAAQKIEENGTFIMELMSREIRVSTILDTDQTPTGDSLDCSLTTLKIQHPVNGEVVYALNGGVLQRTAGGVTTDLSSSDVQFSRLNFCLMGSPASDQQTPRVTIIAGIQNKTGKDILTFNLQTTVSSRDIQSELP